MTTQNCAECGTRAEPGQSFCDACGAVLSWTDRGRTRTAERTGERTGGAASITGTNAGAGAGTGAGAVGTATASGSGAAGDRPASGGRSAAADSGEPIPHQTATPPTSASAYSPTVHGASTAPGDTERTDTERTDTERTSADPMHPGPAPAAGPAADAGGSPAHPATGQQPHAAHPASTPYPEPTRQPTPPAPYAHHPAPDETAPTEPVPAATSTPPPAPPALGDTMAARARSLLVPVADPEAQPPAPEAVAPVLPGRPVADRPQVRAPGPEQGAGYGPPCPWCATPNRPDRHYCSRCAMPMAGDDHAPEPHRPWWRRLFGFGNGEIPWAGDRPRLRRTFDRVVTWVTAAVVVALLITVAIYTPDAIQATRDHFAKRAPVPPDRVVASRSYPQHKPELAFDMLNNTWWGPGVSESAEGEWIEARFDEPTRLLDVIITSGISARTEDRTKSALPHRLKATITTKDGKETTRQLTLDQSSGGQRRAFRVGEVTKVRFTIESAYQTSGSKQVSIAEIEFFGRSSANSS
ncbi:NADase-type glycan-binding domain-containing protein [Streptomyces sp. NBC_00076]|uniref:NADase-type glycan-binding domain-containing protein n=1 Tax=Streptomyces sp. NBC_00076 TaxID=2975642 RepID=UPI0032553E05